MREVVAATAVNPNTVLKAYRDLEREGLVEARTGHGTFVRALPPGPPPGTHARLGRALAAWVRQARAAGLEDEAIESLLGSRCRRLVRRTSHDTRDRDQRADQTVPPGHRAERLHDQRSRRPDIRARRAERRGQDHAAAAAGRARRADRGPRRRARRHAAPGSGVPGGDRLPGPGDPAVPAADRQDHIGIGAHLNPRWDGESVRARLAGLKIPLDRPAGTLSGGQRAQLALALTLAKRPRLLLLDEPLAALDPLARRDFLAALAEAAAGGDLTIVLSSHLIADIERVCDHLILLAGSRVQLCGDTETLLAQHRILTGPRKDTTAIARTHVIVREDTTARQTTLLVRLNGPVIDPAWAVEEPNLEEIVLGYMARTGRPRRRPRGSPPVSGRRRSMTWSPGGSTVTRARRRRAARRVAVLLLIPGCTRRGVDSALAG